MKNCFSSTCQVKPVIAQVKEKQKTLNFAKKVEYQLTQPSTKKKQKIKWKINQRLTLHKIVNLYNVQIKYVSDLRISVFIVKCAING